MTGTKAEIEAVQGEPSSGRASRSAPASNLELERALAGSSSVAECAVLMRSSSQGELRIAYVVATGPFTASSAERTIREKAPGLPVPDAYVLVTRLPFGSDGKLDELELARVPLIEESVAHALEAELLADSRVEHCAVFVDESPRPAPALHLSDLLPPEAYGNPPQTSALAAAVDRDEPATAPRDVAREAALVSAVSRPPAICYGGELVRATSAARTLPEALENAARRTSDHRITYLREDGTALDQSFQELLSHARRIGAGLQSRGFTPGQHVLMQLGRPEDVIRGFWGCLLAGLIPAMTPIPASYAAGTNEVERLCHIWQLLDAPVLLTREHQRPALAPMAERLGIANDRLLTLEALEGSAESTNLPSLSPDDVAFLVFTSGSTGAPKIIMLSHANILTRSQGTNQLCRHEESDRILNWLPFDHIGSISDWHLRCVDLGCHMVYCSKEYVLGDPLNWLRLIDRFRITHSWAPNFAYALVNEAVSRSTERWNLSSMVSLLTAGETVSSNTVHEFLRRLEPHGLARTALRPAYGMAELGSGVTYFQPSERTPVRVVHVDRGQLEGALRVVEQSDPVASAFTSLGPVIPGAGMRIVDDQNAVLPELTIGRLQISGGPVCRGYFRNPDANREVFVGDGWFNTGDRGFIAAGELYLTGRDKESLIINGANFHNSEIEAAVEEVAGVDVSFTAACAVRRRGLPEEQLAVFFSAQATGPALTQILRRIQNGIARKTGVKPDYLVPVGRHVIPKTAIGKIQRKQLAKRFDSGEFDDSVKKVDLLLENEQTLPDWFLSPSWRAQALKRRAAKRPRRCILISDRDHLADALANELLQRGASVVRVVRGEHRPESAAGDGFTDVIHLGGLGVDASAQDGTGLSGAAAAMLAEITRWLPVLDASSPTPVHNWVIAGNSQAVFPEDVVDPIRAMVPPLLKALAQETPGLECRHLDLPMTADPVAARDLGAWVADELEDLSPDQEVAFRRGIRFVPGFTRVSFSRSAASAPLERGGLYLVTGGLGGVGFELSRYLLTHWSAKLLIVGRTRVAAPPDGDDGSSDFERRLRDLEQFGTVRYRTLDVTRTSDLRQAVEETESELGRSLDGVFHLASAYHEQSLATETRDSLTSVLSAKIGGAVAAHALLERRPHAFVACFSSLASLFSGSGIGAYAAANRFLDGFCREQRNRHGRRSYSFNWSVWEGLGIGAASAPAEVLRSKGYRKIPVAQGMASLAVALSRGADQLLVGVDVSHPALLRLTAGPPEPVARLRGAVALRGDGEAAAPDRALLTGRAALDRFGQAAPSEIWQLPVAPLTADGKLDRDAIRADLRGSVREIAPPTTPLQQRLVQVWKEVLGVETLGVNESFFDLGGTSLLSVRLFAEIERQIGPRLAPATLFQAATVRAMAELIGEDSPSGAVESVVTLAEGPGEAALFLIHGADGETALYRDLARKLGSRIRVYGVEPHREGRFLALDTRFDQIVSHLATKIREVQPNAPYLLGGAAEGGVLAFEVACHLQTQGHEVSMVALIDSLAGDLRSRRRRSPAGARRRQAGGSSDVAGLQRILVASQELRDAVRSELRSRAKDGIDAVRARMLRHYGDGGRPPPWFLELVPPRAVYRLAMRGYRPSVFRGRLTLFRAGGAAMNGDTGDTPEYELCHDEMLGWTTRSTQGVDAIALPGGHLSLLSEPHVSSLAQALSTKIANLDAR